MELEIKIVFKSLSTNIVPSSKPISKNSEFHLSNPASTISKHQPKLPQLCMSIEELSVREKPDSLDLTHYPTKEIYYLDRFLYVNKIDPEVNCFCSEKSICSISLESTAEVIFCVSKQYGYV